MKISILIPVNDFDIVALVHCMKDGMEHVPEFCEIIIGDDGSSEEYKKKYKTLVCDKVKLVTSEKNIGRASIRNRLILEASGDFLLFIDADTMIRGTAEYYLHKWIEYVDYARVISGGILYQDSPPGDPDKILRWKYGREKEQKKASYRNKHPYSSFSTFNVMIDKSIFSKLRFYEELKQYGHEDTLFSYQLKKAGIAIYHIDNGLFHEGLETNKEYLAKTKDSIENLSKLYDNVTDKKTFSFTVGLLRVFWALKTLRLTRLVAGIFIRLRERMEIRLDSSKVSLPLFCLYKISMFCTFREIHRRRKLL
ncbi:MAG: glycosyltransferase family 2 protein, partial [Bacteroidia bacterium]